MTAQNVTDGTKRVELLGCPFDLVTMAQVVDTCLAWCRGPRRSHTVVTMGRDAELREACVSGDLIVPDGVPIVWSSKLIGTPLTERVPGVDLMVELLEAASRHNLRVFFLGSRQEVLEKLLEVCEKRYQGMVAAGSRTGYFGPDDHATVIEEIRGSEPDLLFVGMPSPFKETWCQQHRETLCVPVILGVGGSFDILAGSVPRAPRFLQNVGMEWSWRLMMEPRRMWKRYLVSNAMFIWSVLWAILRQRLAPVKRW